MAKAFLLNIDSQLSPDIVEEDTDKIPNFYLPLPFACYLPGDLLYIKIKAIKETNSKV